MKSCRLHKCGIPPSWTWNRLWNTFQSRTSRRSSILLRTVFIFRLFVKIIRIYWWFNSIGVVLFFRIDFFNFNFFDCLVLRKSIFFLVCWIKFIQRIILRVIIFCFPVLSYKSSCFFKLCSFSICFVFSCDFWAHSPFCIRPLLDILNQFFCLSFFCKFFIPACKPDFLKFLFHYSSSWMIMKVIASPLKSIFRKSKLYIFSGWEKLFKR